MLGQALKKTMARAKRIAKVTFQNKDRDINVWVCKATGIAIIHQNGGIWNLQNGKGVFVLAQHYYPELICQWYQNNREDKRVIKEWYSNFHSDNEFVSEPIFYNI